MTGWPEFFRFGAGAGALPHAGAISKSARKQATRRASIVSSYRLRQFRQALVGHAPIAVVYEAIDGVGRDGAAFGRPGGRAADAVPRDPFCAVPTHLVHARKRARDEA